MRNDTQRKTERQRLLGLQSAVNRLVREIEDLSDTAQVIQGQVTDMMQAQSTEDAITGDLAKRLLQPAGLYAKDHDAN